MTNHQSYRLCNFYGRSFLIPNSPSIPWCDFTAEFICNPVWLSNPTKQDGWERVFHLWKLNKLIRKFMKGGDFYRRTVVCIKWVTPLSDLDQSRSTARHKCVSRAAASLQDCPIFSNTIRFIVLACFPEFGVSFTITYVMGQSTVGLATAAWYNWHCSNVAGCFLSSWAIRRLLTPLCYYCSHQELLASKITLWMCFQGFAWALVPGKRTLDLNTYVLMLFIFLSSFFLISPWKKNHSKLNAT